jgi:hypothetical protein
MAISFSLNSHDLLSLFVAVFVASFAWALGGGVYALLAGGFASLRRRRDP